MGRFRAKAVLTLAVVFGAGLAVASATFGQRLIILLPPDLQLAYTARPVPVPAPSEGRVPVGLRLAASISTEDGSHPPAATELKFKLDRQMRIVLADAPRCPSGSHFDVRTGKSPCETVRLASGRSRWEVAFPGQQPLQVTGRTIAYKIGPRKMAFWTYLSAPVTAEILIPVELKRAPGESVYGTWATASIPKVAGGSGSLLHLGLRFREGLFSLACSKRRLQSGLDIRFVDGRRLYIASIVNC
ncbi:MAG TPA: hypothetical protein VFY75_05715 [Solirubrobacterales bacterium]|nr:hypothetical protein [Solirubrobacterales bacterium]